MTNTTVLGRALAAKPDFQSMRSPLAALAITAVFAIDCLTPIGIGVPFLYILILWIALAWTTPRQALAIAAVSSLLTVVGFFLSPEGDLAVGLANRAITLATLLFLGAKSAHIGNL